MILTNLEYARDEGRTDREASYSLEISGLRWCAPIRSRGSAGSATTRSGRSDRIVKARARRYIAAGSEEWLDPDIGDVTPWSDLRGVLRPHERALLGSGGELYAKFGQDGSIHYQDQFGRTERGSDFLKKVVVEAELRPGDACGCGSNISFKVCCKPLPPKLRPSWTERGIRERNMMLYRGVTRILGLDQGRNWLEVRRNITNDHIRDVHILYRALWPIETDILHLLPKPNGRPRAVYTGSLHPEAITDFALGAALYFGELIVENPFVHAAHVRPEFNPINNPQAYHQEFIKTVFLFLTLMPLVETGYVNLIPDPTVFDLHLQEQMMHLARERSATMKVSSDLEPRAMELMKLDFKRNLMSMPDDGLRRQLRTSSPELSETEMDDVVAHIRRARDLDPLAAVHEGLLDGKGGQLNLAKMAPNFEMALYIAQATGASIVTNSPHRWREIQLAVARQGGGQPMPIPALVKAIGAKPMGFVNDLGDFFAAASTQAFDGYPPGLRDASKYLAQIEQRGIKPNFEAGLAARLRRLHRTSQAALRKKVKSFSLGRVHGLFPAGGIHDNTVNRLLLMSSSEHHLPACRWRSL